MGQLEYHPGASAKLRTLQRHSLTPSWGVKMWGEQQQKIHSAVFLVLGPRWQIYRESFAIKPIDFLLFILLQIVLTVKLSLDLLVSWQPQSCVYHVVGQKMSNLGPRPDSVPDRYSHSHLHEGKYVRLSSTENPSSSVFSPGWQINRQPFAVSL